MLFIAKRDENEAVCTQNCIEKYFDRDKVISIFLHLTDFLY